MRKIDGRLPLGFQAMDLGEATVASDGRCALVSFATAPIVVARDNTYVVFVTDPTLAANARSFEWTFKEDGDVTRVEASEGAEVVHRPASLGPLSVSLRVLDAASVEQATLSLEQVVVPPSAELEALISDAQNKPGPGASNPEVLRELVNQHCRYYQDAAPRTPEPGDAFARFLFSVASSGASRRTEAERRQHIEQLALALEQQRDDFARLAATGVGVADIRLSLLAMVQPRTAGGTTPFLSWQELPEAQPQRSVADERVRGALAALSEDALVDLVNIARFPKTNLAACARILESLRDRYFASAKFEDVLTGMSGTRAHWIVTHYTEGPIARR